MTHPAVDKFGKLVVTTLRDNAIEFFDRAAEAHGRSAGLQGIQQELAQQSPEQISLIRRCVIQAVDHGMHDFLFALAEANGTQDIRVLVNGENVADLSDGLHGEQFTHDGWIAKFGKYPEELP